MNYTSPGHTFILLTVVIVISTSCTSSGPSGIFGKRSPHDQYGERIKSAGLSETTLGRKWFEAAGQSLSSPLTVSIPYKETGYFPSDEPKAVGLIFGGKRGEKLTISVQKNPAAGFAVYLDLWERAASGEATPKFILAGDTLLSAVSYEVEKDANYILRLQPELLKGGEYTISITTGPSLAFPVTPKIKSNIGSFWGVARDAGARRHEGIDIFAPRRTALVAAADGVVTRVNENTLGGKAVFLTPANKNYTLYYAHLDEQLVQPGQEVKSGDTIGLMGNTGNARYTVPHLHFGIYTNSGAVDPLPFVNRVTKMPDKIAVSLANLDKWVRNNKEVKMFKGASANSGGGLPVDANTLMKVEAATAGWYKVSLPGGEKGFVHGAGLIAASSAIRKISLKDMQPLLDQPLEVAARKTTLAKGQDVNMLGLYNDFYYVTSGNVEGWIPKKAAL